MAVRPPPHGWRCFLSLSTRGRCCCGWCCFELAFASCVVLVSPPSSFLVLLAFSLPLVRGAVFSSSFICGAVFLPLPCGWCCLPSPSFIVVLRCCCHSPPKLNWTPQTQHKTKRKWTYWLFMFDKLLLHFWSCFSSIFLLFHFIFLLACSLLGRFIEGIQI